MKVSINAPMIKPVAHTASLEPVACQRCGGRHERPTKPGHPTCSGHRKRDGVLLPCIAWPNKGQRICQAHGASAPQAKKAAARRLEAEAVAGAIRSYGLRLDLPADEVLLDELAWTAGHVLWLRQRVQAIEPEALVWGVVDEVDKGGEFPTVDRTSAAKPSVWVELYQKERKHLLEVIKTVKVLDLDAKRLDFAKAQVAPQIMSVIEGFVVELGLTSEQAARVPSALERAVRVFMARPGETRVIEGVSR